MPPRANSILCLCLMLAQAPLQAQSTTGAEQDFFAESPLILTVSRMSKPLLESPASVSVIDRAMIEASGAREIADLMRMVPGFVVGYHSGHAPVVSYHGLGQEFGRQMQVLVDGRSVFIPSFGGVPWSNLPLLLQDIERIEIIRGPNAVSYGANAFLATINIITRHAAEDQGTYYSVSASDNSNPDIEDAYLRVGRQFDNLDWRLSLGAINDEGFAAINDSRRIARLNFRLDLAPSANQFWTLQAGNSSSRLGRGFPQSADNPTDIERNEEAMNSYLGVQWEGIWDASSTLVRLTHTRQEVSDHYDPGSFEFSGFTGVTTFIDFDRLSERSDLELVQNAEISADLRLVFGGGLRKDRVQSLFLLNSERFHDVDTGRVFGSLEWRFAADWLLDIGAMLEDSNLTTREASPRISLLRKFGRRHALRLVTSSAKRNPILFEAKGETEFVADIPPFGRVVVPTWRGNGDADPENIMAYEIGLRSRLENGLGSDIKLFSYRIDDHLVDTTVAVDAGPPLGVIPVATTTNAEETEVRGVELTLDYRPGRKLEIHAGLSLLSAESSLERFEDSFPDQVAFANASYQFDSKQRVSATYYYLGEISWIDSSADIPITRRLDLRYAYDFGNQTRLEVIGQNLLEDIVDYEPENRHDQVVFLRISSGF